MSDKEPQGRATDATPTPDILQPGQNFYDQSPFSLVSLVLQRDHGVHIDATRIIFTNIAQVKAVIHEDPTPEEIEVRQRQLLLNIEREFASPKRRKLKVSPSQIANIVPEASRLLDKFPLWEQYVATNLEDYEMDGVTKPITYGKIETYRKWLIDNSQRHERLKYKGINTRMIERTPQGLAKRAIKDTNNRHFK